MTSSVITLSNLIEVCENTSSRILDAPLVGYDALGSLRYIVGFDIHTTEDGEEDFRPFITSSQIMFVFGDIVDEKK